MIWLIDVEERRMNSREFVLEFDMMELGLVLG
jgi:hypothetical protein